MQITSDLADYKLVHGFNCDAEAGYTLADSKNGLLSCSTVSNDQNLIGMAVDFNESVLPLIKEKKDVHTETIDRLCQEMEELGADLIAAEKDLAESEAEAHRLREKTSAELRARQAEQKRETKAREEEME